MAVGEKPRSPVSSVQAQVQAQAKCAFGPFGLFAPTEVGWSRSKLLIYIDACTEKHSRVFWKAIADLIEAARNLTKTTEQQWMNNN